MKATELVADFVTRTSWEDVPDEAHQRSKWAIVDCLAAGFAGIQHEVGQQITALVKEVGGRPVASVWGAYANGTLAHAIDYDDVNEHMGGHPTTPEQFAALMKSEIAKYAKIIKATNIRIDN